MTRMKRLEKISAAALLGVVALIVMGCSLPLGMAGLQPTSTPTASLQPAVSLGPTQAPFLTATPLPTRTLIPSATASPTLSPIPTRTSWPSATPLPAMQPTATPTQAEAMRAAGASSSRSASSLAGTLVFQLFSGGPIYAIGADGTGLRTLTHGLDPALSPDGQRVAFARWDGPQRGLWIVDVEGGGEEFVFGHGQLKAPAWTPDGTAIVFTRQEGEKPSRQFCFPPFGCFTFSADPYWRLARVTLWDRSFRDIPSDLHSHSPVVERSGKRVIYIGDSGVQFSAVDGNEEGILRQENFLSSPALSPDGKQVVYMVRLHDHWDLFISPLDGPAQTRLTSSSALAPRAPNNVAPAWSPDGRAIAFLTDRDGTWRLYVMNSDGSDQHPLLPKQLDDLTFNYDFVNERVVSWGP